MKFTGLDNLDKVFLEQEGNKVVALCVSLAAYRLNLYPAAIQPPSVDFGGSSILEIDTTTTDQMAPSSPSPSTSPRNSAIPASPKASPPDSPSRKSLPMRIPADNRAKFIVGVCALDAKVSWSLFVMAYDRHAQNHVAMSSIA